MIVGLQNTHPTLETYIQSLWPRAKEQSAIDDAFFLSTVDFTRDYKDGDRARRGRQTFLFGGNPASRKIRVDNGEKWNLNPNGYLDMLFVDIDSFDADTYTLSYLRSESSNDRVCYVYYVSPHSPKQQGRFKGQIWVEINQFKIIRIKGIFTSPLVPIVRRIVGGTIPIYLNFDSFRQEVAPGRWLPSYALFDENRSWKELNHNGETDFHYRGYTFIWGYPQIAANDHDLDLLGQIDKDNVLAKTNVVEQDFNQIVQTITKANNLDLRDVQCRVLLTTPLDFFHIGHTIVLSRGLLNILPDDSVLPLLLSREIAGIIASDAHKANDTESGNTALWKTGIAFADRARFQNGLPSALLLLYQLRQSSRQVPHLAEPRFGSSVLTLLSGIQKDSAGRGPTAPVSPLTLRGKYTIDAWGAKIVDGRERNRSSSPTVNDPTSTPDQTAEFPRPR